MFAKATTLSNEFTTNTVDTAIGGTIGLLRCQSRCFADTEYQLDGFAVHFSRWSEAQFSVAGDYRYGFPITFRHECWEGKVGYEHTSTHVGDDLIRKQGRYRNPYVRDEIVLALAYRWCEQLRIYGECAYAFSMSSPVPSSRERFAGGAEWSRPCATGWKGQPFAAFDLDLRPEQDYTANLTLQLGWQWIPELGRPSARVALEYYRGNSPFGQLLLEREQWLGVGFYVDF